MTPDSQPPAVFPVYTPPVQPPATQGQHGFATRKQSGQLFKIIRSMVKTRIKGRVSKPKKRLGKHPKIDKEFGV